jgi:glutamate-ammonia-ligase adenylyltransferase
MEQIIRRPAYVSLLTRRHDVFDAVAKLFIASDWVAAYVAQHPILLDKLLPQYQQYQPSVNINWDQCFETWRDELLSLSHDEEAQIERLRYFKQVHIFHLVQQDVLGKITLESLSDALSDLAITLLKVSHHVLWQQSKYQHQATPYFGMIAYGRLGGLELGYQSDLDLVFVFDDPHPEASVIYTKHAKKLMTWISSQTRAGRLYDIDLRLRPNGDSGLVVCSLAYFAQYQQTAAWLWEQQALTRARYIVGDTGIADQFNALRLATLTQIRDEHLIKSTITSMRHKISLSHPPHWHDLKYARGGIVDVEFIVQALILLHSHQHPSLTENKGNIALLQRAANAALIPKAAAQKVADAYRFYRKQQHLQALHSHKKQLDETLYKQHYATTMQLWMDVFGAYETLSEALPTASDNTPQNR